MFAGLEARLSFQECFLRIGGIEEFLHYFHGHLGIKGLAREDIKVCVIRFFYEVGGYAGCFNELDKAVASHTPFAESDNSGSSVGLHFNAFHKFFRECLYFLGGTNGTGVTRSGIYE